MFSTCHVDICMSTLLDVNSFRRVAYRFYRPQQSCEGYVFTPVCDSVHRGDVLSQHALQVVSQHALQQGGACSFGGCLLQGVCSLGGASSGESAPRGGVCCWGVCSWVVGGVETPQPPENRWLLLQTVHILLECILVKQYLTSQRCK